MLYNETPSGPTELNQQVRLPRSTAIIWLAVLWTVGLFLLLPAIDVNRNNPPPAGFILALQIAVTTISAVAGAVLLFLPRKRWLLVNLPFVLFLVVVTRTVWTHFP